MIKTITIHKTEKLHFTNKLYHNKNKDIIYEFTDGINIITGRNGSGKSVLLNIIKTSCGIENESTYPRMPSPMDLHGLFRDNDDWDSISDHINKKVKSKGYPSNNIDWDGAMVHHLTPDFFNPKDLWRLMDSPYPNQGSGLFNTGEVLGLVMSKNSKGEGAIRLLNKIYNLNTEYDCHLNRVNEIWLKASEIFQNWLSSFPTEKGKPTLLIDELDSNLDLDNQKQYWEYINSLTKKWQIIVVSHSIFAFRNINANHIKLNPEYFNKVKKL